MLCGDSHVGNTHQRIGAGGEHLEVAIALDMEAQLHALGAARITSYNVCYTKLLRELVEDASAEIIGEAPAMQEVFRAIGRLSHSNITVLINGESGTGKELVAHALHRHSPRAARPFIPLNMAAIPKDLIESELFGHEKSYNFV